MALARTLAAVALVGVALVGPGGCGGGSGEGGGGAGGSGGSGGGASCPSGQLADAEGSCTPIGIQGCAAAFVDADGICRPASAKCKAGTIADFASGCVAVGIPKCDPTFIAADGLCHPTQAKCPSGTFAVPQKGCVAIDGKGCGSGTWGDIPDGPGTLYVDASYDGGDGDGSQASPFPTIAAAMTEVRDGGRIAIAAGRYTEPVVVDKAIELVGRCPSMVTIDGNDGDPQVPAVILVIAPATIRGVRISGDGVGVYVGATAGVTLDGVHIDQTQFVGVAVVTAPTDVTIVNSLISKTRGLDQAGGNGISVVDGAALEISDSALSGNHIAGIGAGDKGSTVDANDVLIEDTLGQESDGNGGQGVILTGGASLKLDASAIVASTYVGLDAAAGVVKASGVLIEGTRPDPIMDAFGGGIDVSDGADLTLEASVVAHNHAFGIYGHGTFTKVHVTGSLVSDTQTERSNGGFGVGVIAQDAAVVDVADSTFAKSRELGADATSHASLTLTRVLLEDTLGKDDGTWGIGAGVTGGAALTLVSTATSGARGAGLLNAQGTATITGSIFTGIASGDFALIGAPEPLTGVGDGVLTTFGGATTMSASRAERCFRAGILFDSSTGQVSASSSEGNHFGLVLDGMPLPTYDTTSAFDGNEKGIVNDGMLPVPNAPAVLPE